MKPAMIITNQMVNYDYGPKHPMKPIRVSMTYELLQKYELLEKFDLFQAMKCQDEDLLVFHTNEYVNFMKNYNYLNEEDKQNHSHKINFEEHSEDLPAFQGFYEFSKLVAGSSIQAANLLAQRKNEIVVNWNGGLHHAQKNNASGFCYVNDCVLAIQRLLYNFKKVLYIDIDVHHGDGVEEAFKYNPRVLTLSFHQYGFGFFPGTGAEGNIEDRQLKNTYALNVPLKQGCKDLTYELIFKRIIDQVIISYMPSAIVLQCGADSLIGDSLGVFNLSLLGHKTAVEYVLKKNIPTILLGGGGYNIDNVARCWTIESGMVVGHEFDQNEKLPENLQFTNYYLNRNDLFWKPVNQHDIYYDQNDESYKTHIFKHLQREIQMCHGDIDFLKKPDINHKLTQNSSVQFWNKEIDNFKEKEWRRQNSGMKLNIKECYSDGSIIFNQQLNTNFILKKINLIFF